MCPPTVEHGKRTVDCKPQFTKTNSLLMKISQSLLDLGLPQNEVCVEWFANSYEG